MPKYVEYTPTDGNHTPNTDNPQSLDDVKVTHTDHLPQLIVAGPVWFWWRMLPTLPNLSPPTLQETSVSPQASHLFLFRSYHHEKFGKPISTIRAECIWGWSVNYGEQGGAPLVHPQPLYHYFPDPMT